MFKPVHEVVLVHRFLSSPSSGGADGLASAVQPTTLKSCDTNPSGAFGRDFSRTRQGNPLVAGVNACQ
jgi:hypothetical protein